MTEVTRADRENELNQLLQKVSEQPNRPWTAERERIAVLQRQLAAQEKASA